MTDVVRSGERAEEWRIIAEFPAYSVSSNGRVRRDAACIGGHGSTRIPTGFICQRSLPRGHMQVTLSMAGKPATVLVHRLVANAFLPPPEIGQNCVLHSDDDPANNRPGNLRWGSRADNAADRVKRGRSASGERAGGSKLNPHLVASIRDAVRAGERQREVALRFGIAQSNVSLICSGRTWAHVS